MSARPNRCFFCGTLRPEDNVTYCSVCRKSFCNNCRHRYKDRVDAMMSERLETIEDGLQKAWNWITGK